MPTPTTQHTPGPWITTKSGRLPIGIGAKSDEFKDGSLSGYDLDPENHAQVFALIERAEVKFKLAARAWEAGNNSGDPAELFAASQRCDRYRRAGEKLLGALGIVCSWPGLYPAFEVDGHTEYTCAAAVLAALGKPRDWLRRWQD